MVMLAAAGLVGLAHDTTGVSVAWELTEGADVRSALGLPGNDVDGPYRSVL